ncbi:cardiolipin synthase [Gracilibacillus ureilyticus]|uniref:Cardiolipin synthase n=1 Tax=Gracilibacillus ureilyticus TaxID=531814 RepID=A0A1H9STW2_9BACI|nr:phospholipase D-like domain-containing protein [Gracilibacillus ureilyticus]SER88440.1 cardiolipin synthase [Gracilibacillus ureilyticus]
MLYIFGLLIVIIVIILDYQLGKQIAKKKNQSKKWTTSSDNVDVFADGQQLFDQMFEDIQQARQSIDIQFYIIRNDKISNQLYSLLIKKQAEGVKVRLLTDWAGSILFKKKWMKQQFELKKTNVPKFPFFYHLQQRNHRKVMIIDEKIAYAGGFNLGDEYVGKDIKLGKWRDYHVRITGAVVGILHHTFLNDWNGSRTVLKTEMIDGDRVDVYTTEAGVLEGNIIEMFNSASHSIEIGSPYFIPTRKVLSALLEARKRGVSITFLLPEKGDHLLTKAGAMPFLEIIHHHGVDIYLYMDGFFHGKVFFIDQKICDVGTSNFDQRSFLLNQEINLVIDNSHPLYSKMRSLYEKDLAESKEFTLQWKRQQPLWMKMITFFTTFIRPFL